VDFLPDSDQETLVEATRQFIEKRFPLTESTARPDDTGWREIAELGWLGLAADEAVGGANAGLIDEVLVFREIGRGLVPGPVLATLAAARLAAWVGDASLASSLIAGRSRVARAVPLPGRESHLLLLDTEAAPLTLFVDERRADLFPTPAGLELHPGLENGTQVSQVPRSTLENPELGTDDPALVARLRRLLSILTAAQLAGICGATTDLAVAHAKTRVQFGKPIGAFQAIKHKCADMATNALAADNVTYFAALTESNATAGSDYHVLAAAAFTRRAAFANARANVQIHGAMGFTVEDSAHRFVKRTHTLCITEEFDRAAERLGRLPSVDTSEES